MPPKKEPKTKSDKSNSKNKEKKVRFNKDDDKNNLEENNNVFVNAPKKENYPFTGDIINDNDDEELQKGTELDNENGETEKEEMEETEQELIDEEAKDEDDDLDDEIEYDDEPDANDDDLFDDEEKVKSRKKKKGKSEDDDFEDLEDECEYDYGEIYDVKKEEPLEVVSNEQRITLPKLTKYEKVRLIGTRAKQISLGAKVMLKNTEGLHPIEIAKLELEHKMIPMKIKRVLPNNKIEI